MDFYLKSTAQDSVNCLEMYTCTRDCQKSSKLYELKKQQTNTNIFWLSLCDQQYYLHPTVELLFGYLANL